MNVYGLFIAAALDYLPLRLANDFIFVCNENKRSEYLTGDTCWVEVAALCLLLVIIATIFSYLMSFKESCVTSQLKKKLTYFCKYTNKNLITYNLHVHTYIFNLR